MVQNKKNMLRILSVGGFKGVSNTCLHRHWALKYWADYIDEISTNEKPWSLLNKISFHLFQIKISVPLLNDDQVNRKILNLINRKIYDIVWIDKGLTINPSTLKKIKKKQPQCIIISYSPDNMVLRHNQSCNYVKCIPLYDYHITTKSYITKELQNLGAKNIIFTNKSYESTFHYPRKLTTYDIEKLGGDIGFIGAWEKERCESILYLVKRGLNVRIFGGGKWLEYKNKYSNLKIEDSGLFSEDYSKALQAFKISLCFLRKINSDLQTSRSMEIPACGGFMIAERTNEHLSLFREDEEAVFFSSNEELYDKCKYYLLHTEEREAIARAGHIRCQESGYSNLDTIKRILNLIAK